MTKARFPEVDFLRGLAVIGMIIFHAFFMLDYYAIFPSQMYSGAFLFLLNFVRFTFIGLVGVSLALSHQRANSIGLARKKFATKTAKRGFKILMFAYLITLVSFIFLPEDFVRFGILHLIGFGVLLLSPLADKKYQALAFSLIILFAYPFIEASTANPANLGLLNYIAYAFGIMGQETPTLDYYPILPWFALISFGIFLANSFYKTHRPSRFFSWIPSRIPSQISSRSFSRVTLGVSTRILSGILFMGRHSLVIYLLHIPLILLIFLAAGLIPIDLFYVV